jgi:hypothetical protein
MGKKEVLEGLQRIGGVLRTARFTEPVLNSLEHSQLAKDWQTIYDYVSMDEAPEMPEKKPVTVEEAVEKHKSIYQDELKRKP